MKSVHEAAERGLAIRYFLEDPDPVLSQVCDPVSESEFGLDCVKVGEEIIRVMRSGRNGVGMAAPQAGLLKRIFVMLLTPDKFERQAVRPDIYELIREGEPLVLCNPDLRPLGDEMQTGQEGCLSIPGVYNQVKRHVNVEVAYSTPLGEAQSIALHGFDARVAQHENDHLDGLMFFDRMTKNMRKHTLREWEKERRKLKI